MSSVFKIKGGCIFNSDNKSNMRVYYFVQDEQEQDLTKRSKYFIFDVFGEKEINQKQYYDDCYGTQASFEYRMMMSNATVFLKASQYFNNFWNKNSFCEKEIIKGAKFFKMLYR